MRSCTRIQRSIWLFSCPLSAFSTRKTPSSVASQSPPSGTGAVAAAVAHTAVPSSGEPAARGATEGRWTSLLTPTSSASTWVMDTSLAGGGMCSRSRSAAAMTGRGSWRRRAARWLPSCRSRVSSASSARGALRLKAPPSTGRACSRSTDRDGSTPAKSSLSHGNRPSCGQYPGEFARGLFHSDGWRGVNRVRRRLAGGDRWYEYPRYLFANESTDILRLCGETLDRLGVAWRYSRRNAISVARREAVARLDEFVGPKY